MRETCDDLALGNLGDRTLRFGQLTVISQRNLLQVTWINDIGYEAMLACGLLADLSALSQPNTRITAVKGSRHIGHLPMLSSRPQHGWQTHL
jgi:hypothetical protein